MNVGLKHDRDHDVVLAGIKGILLNKNYTSSDKVEAIENLLL